MKRYLNRHTYAAVFTALLLSFFSITVNRIKGGDTLFVDEFIKKIGENTPSSRNGKGKAQ